MGPELIRNNLSSGGGGEWSKGPLLLLQLVRTGGGGWVVGGPSGMRSQTDN